MSGSLTRWWWIRHAPVTADGGRIYGQMDLPADCSDVPAFRRLARQLPPAAVLLTSHLQRTHQTADGLRAGGAVLDEAQIEPELCEQHFGDWQGEDRATVFREQAEWHGFWLAPAETAPPGGESFVDLLARVSTTIDRLTGEHAGRNIVAVAHGGTIRAALCHALDMEPARALSFSVDNLSLTRIDHIDGGKHGRGWRVAAVNFVPPA